MEKRVWCDQLEEGEIVDDDFEDISDNSIIDMTFGKCSPPDENLRALSLSSHNTSENSCKIVRLKRKFTACKDRLKHRRRNMAAAAEEVNSSDSGSEYEAQIRDKLKEAVYIASAETERKKTLEARLRGMGGLAATPDSPPPNLAPQLESSDNIDDNEIENLRIEALRTAVMNRFKLRTQRKNAALVNITIENKENDTPGGGGDLAEDEEEEEDEDLLRASLLASLADKITSKNQTKTPKALDVKPRKKILQNRPNTVVKPLIIKLNCSESDSESGSDPVPDPAPIQPTLNIDYSVDKFLKEQRAKHETELLTNVAKQEIARKPAVQLLPKSQQLEYQELLRKLKSAELRAKNKVKLTKIKQGMKALAEGDKKKIGSVVENIAEEAAPTNGEIKPLFSAKNRVLKRGSKMDVSCELLLLQKTLREMKTFKNGRSLILNSNNLKIEHGTGPVISSLPAQSVSKNNKKTEIPPREKTIEKILEPENNNVDVTNAPALGYEDMDVCTSDEADIYHFDIADPNDIDRIFQKKAMLPIEVPDYVSPINIYDRYKPVDPLGVMCPYEISGSCRDCDCTFEHYHKH